MFGRAAGFLIFFAIQIWSGKAIKDVGRALNRDDRPRAFWYTVGLSLVAALFLLGALAHVTLTE